MALAKIIKFIYNKIIGLRLLVGDKSVVSWSFLCGFETLTHLAGYLNLDPKNHCLILLPVDSMLENKQLMSKWKNNLYFKLSSKHEEAGDLTKN